VKDCDDGEDFNRINKDKTALFQDLLMEWYDLNGRKNLPWRNTKDTWRVLVAGILLRKTTVNQVLEVYDDFILKYPTAAHIIEADDEELRRESLTLGMENIKIEQLKAASRTITEEHDSQVPAEYSQLKSLKGVGDYIASEIQLIAYDVPRPLLDRNMIRIISRVFSFASEKKRPHTDKALWRFAGLLVPSDIDKERRFNFGVLDLGYLVCSARSPKCTVCPVSSVCDHCGKEELRGWAG